MQTTKTFSVEPNQTLYDLAIQHYGTGEAIAEMIALNPHLRNDKNALAAQGIEPQNEEFYLDISIEPGFKLQINTDSKQIKNAAIREITSPITTYTI
ncbi:MAG: hypothetical protein RR328_04695 [Bacteroidales bacterium]